MTEDQQILHQETLDEAASEARYVAEMEREAKIELAKMTDEEEQALVDLADSVGD